MLNYIIIGIFYLWLVFFVLRAVSKIVFKPLTAHWFALGVSASYCLGFVIVLWFYSLNLLESRFQFQQSIIYYLASSWLAALIPLNLVILPGLYWWDKRLAIKKTDDDIVRIPENALHALAFSGGFLGAFIGQKVFHHKVFKGSFQIKHYLVCGLSLMLYVSLAYKFFIQ